MYKSLVMLAFCSAVDACAAPQPAGVQSAGSATAQSSVEECELVREEATGTRITARQVCRNVQVQDKH